MKYLSIIVVATTLLLSGCGMNSTPGDGEKIGQIVKFGKSGIIWKTWQGQLIRGGLSGGSGAVGGVPFDFTVENPELIAKIKQLMDSQTEVIITYQTEFIYSVARSGTEGHFITDIRAASTK